MRIQPLVLSHFTAVNALGHGAAATLAALRERRTGLRPNDFEHADLETYVGRVDGVEAQGVPAELADYDCRNNRLALMGLGADGFERAARDAARRYGAARVGVFLGTSTSGVLSTELAYRELDRNHGALPADYHYRETHNLYSLTDFSRRYLGLRGPALSISTACSSSAKVFATAHRYIQAGICDAAVVGGVDSLCLTTLYGFSSLELVSRDICRPADAGRDGLSIGEGAGFALLERPDRAESGDVLLLGYGESSDAHHMSTPDPRGGGAAKAMTEALARAGLQAGDIDYVNLHGTATPTNDRMEDAAVKQVFGTDTACSSTKGWTGHTLGAAGITEAVISALCLQNGLVPGSLNTRSVDPGFATAVQVSNEQRGLRRVASNSFGFGGNNCCLVFGANS